MKEKGKKTKDRKTQRSGSSYGESVKAKWFFCVFKLGFVQLIRKASLIYKLIKVSLINYFKGKRIIRVKACYGGV